MVNLDADIVPGTSAAGFRIGQSLSEIQAGYLSNCVVTQWNREQGPWQAAIDTTSGWLSCDVRQLLYFHFGAVRLQFNSGGILYDIGVRLGYRGRFAQTVQIGDRLDKVLDLTDLFYDSGDEAHYPTEGSPIRGIAFCATTTSLEDDPDQVITGISVHNWLLQQS